MRCAAAQSGAAGSEQEAIDALERIETDTIIEVLRDCELVIEAAPEDLDLKRNLFERLATACGPEMCLPPTPPRSR